MGPVAYLQFSFTYMKDFVACNSPVWLVPEDMIKVSLIYSGLLFSTSGVVVSGSGVMTGERDHLFNFLKLDYENNDRYANWAALASEKSEEKSHLKRIFSRVEGEPNQRRKKLRNSSSESSDNTQEFVPIESSEDTRFDSNGPISSSSNWKSYGRLGKLRARAEELAASPSTSTSEEVESIVSAVKPISEGSKRKQMRDVFETILKRYSDTEESLRSLYEKYTKDLEQEYPEMRPIKFGAFRNKAGAILRRNKGQTGLARKVVAFTPRHREIIESVCCEYGKLSHTIAELLRVAVIRFQQSGLDPIGVNRFTREYKEIMKNQECLVDGWTEDEVAWFTSMFEEGDEPTQELAVAVSPAVEA